VGNPRQGLTGRQTRNGQRDATSRVELGLREARTSFTDARFSLECGNFRALYAELQQQLSR
jgi:hypothetical protein